jgi:uncharacterized FlgJ-related protein
VKEESVTGLYEFRCGMVHRFNPEGYVMTIDSSPTSNFLEEINNKKTLFLPQLVLFLQTHTKKIKDEQDWVTLVGLLQMGSIEFHQ